MAVNAKLFFSDPGDPPAQAWVCMDGARVHYLALAIAKKDLPDTHNS